MNKPIPAEKKDFSSICVRECGGACCDPWWGIINYTLLKRDALGNKKVFHRELVKSIKIREKRIVDAYITREARPRPLFVRPESYNLIVRDIVEDKGGLRLNLILMMAFRCHFLSKDNICEIHPTIIKGPDIRPPHCGQLGSPGQRPDEQGHCRIIGAAESANSTSAPEIGEAIRIEKVRARQYLCEGTSDLEEAASRVDRRIEEYCEEKHISREARPLSVEKKPGRNAPCSCGSGRKYKKCHGRTQGGK